MAVSTSMFPFKRQIIRCSTNWPIVSHSTLTEHLLCMETLVSPPSPHLGFREGLKMLNSSKGWWLGHTSTTPAANITQRREKQGTIQQSVFESKDQIERSYKYMVNKIKPICHSTLLHVFSTMPTGPLSAPQTKRWLLHWPCFRVVVCAVRISFL